MKTLDIMCGDIPCARVEWDGEAQSFSITKTILLFDTKQRELLNTAISNINLWARTNELPWSEEKLLPWQDKWWDHIRTLLNHSIRLGPTYTE